MVTLSSTTTTATSYGSSFLRHLSPRQAGPFAFTISPKPLPSPPAAPAPAVVVVTARIVRRKDSHLDSLIDTQKRLKTVEEVRSILAKQRPLRREMSVEELAKYSRRTGLRGCRQCLSFLKRYPLIFHVFFLSSSSSGSEEDAAAFFRLTEVAERQLLEEESVREALEPTLLEKLRRILMMSAQKRVLIKKIECISKELGLPDGFLRTSFLESFSGWFKVVETGMGPALELVNPLPLPPAMSSSEEKRQRFKFVETGMGPADMAWDPPPAPLTMSAWVEEEQRFKVAEMGMGPSDVAHDPPVLPAMISAPEEQQRFEVAKTGTGPADVACNPPATSLWEEEKHGFMVAEMGPTDAAQDPPVPHSMMSAWDPPMPPSMSAWEEKWRFKVSDTVMGLVDMAQESPVSSTTSAREEKQRFKLPETGMGPTDMAREPPVPSTTSAWKEKHRFKVAETGIGPADVAWDPLILPPITSAWEAKQKEPISRLITNNNNSNNSNTNNSNNNFPVFRKINLPKGLAVRKKERERIIQSEDLPYISPYCNPPLPSWSIEAEKRACGVVHELLSLTTGKHMRMDHLAHFRSDFQFPQRLRAMLLRHPELFYVSLKGDRNSVFLREAYDRAHLIWKDPLVLAREKWEKLVFAGLGRVAGRWRIEEEEDFDSSLSDPEEWDSETSAINKQARIRLLYP